VWVGSKGESYRDGRQEVELELLCAAVAAATAATAATATAACHPLRLGAATCLNAAVTEQEEEEEGR